MQTLKFRGKTTYLYYKHPKLQVLDEILSMKLVKDSGMTMEDYKQVEEVQLKQLKEKKVVTKEVP